MSWIFRNESIEIFRFSFVLKMVYQLLYLVAITSGKIEILQGEIMTSSYVFILSSIFDLGKNLVYFITGSNSEYASTDGTLAEGRFRNIQDIAVSNDGNKIYVIDAGNVVGEGTHEQLLTNSPVYKNFYEKQIQK